MKTIFVILSTLMTFCVSQAGASSIVEDVNKSELELLKNAIEQAYASQCPDIQNSLDGKFSIDVKSCLPERVSSILGKTANIGGPNCYNFSLFAAGVLDVLRPINGNELEDLYFVDDDKGYCEKVLGNKFSPGQLVSLEKGLRKIHAYVYLTGKYVLTKNGPDTKSKWELSTLASVMDTYPVQKENKVLVGYNCSRPSFNSVDDLNSSLGAIDQLSKVLSEVQLSGSFGEEQLLRITNAVNVFSKNISKSDLKNLINKSGKSLNLRKKIYELVAQYYTIKSVFYLIYHDRDSEEWSENSSKRAENFRVSTVNKYLPILNWITELSPENLFGIGDVYSNEDTVDLGFCEDNNYNPNICSLNI